MAQPITIPAGSKLLIQLGNGAGPEVFSAPCGLTTKGLTFTKNTNDVTVPDCADPELPAWTERGVVAQSAALSGSGILAMEALATWQSWQNRTTSGNVRILVVHATLGGWFAGKFHLTTLTINGAIGDKVGVTVAFESDGPVAWVPTV